jgi:hypothetical protein
MKKKKSLVLLLLAVGSLLVTGGAAAAPALDQRQTTLDEDFTVLIGGDGPQIPGQVVRSGMAGILTAVELPVGCDTPSTSLVVQILDASDRPGTTVIASHTVSGLTDELDWTSIAIPAQRSSPPRPSSPSRSPRRAGAGSCRDRLRPIRIRAGAAGTRARPIRPGSGRRRGRTSASRRTSSGCARSRGSSSSRRMRPGR